MPASELDPIVSDPQLLVVANEEQAIPERHHENLQELLLNTSMKTPDRGLILYPIGDVSSPVKVTYKNLFVQAKELSRVISKIQGFKPGNPVMLYFDTHWDNLLWFWATLLAQGVPVPTPPFSNLADHRHKQIKSLSNLLESPLCITTTKMKVVFDLNHGLKIYTTESLSRIGKTLLGHSTLMSPVHGDDIAMLMLTSGSTGNSKAVILKHSQVLASVAGKSTVTQLSPTSPFLNWIGLDHVGALIEIHFHALYHGVDQIHVQATDMLCSPRLFLDLLSRHQVSRSFAPNFFLAKLANFSTSDPFAQSSTWNFKNLRFLVSGGEANDLETCVAVSSLLASYGAPTNVIAPGFGMTETCAGAIYSINCPEVDIRNGSAFASLGKCMEGIEMRIACPTTDGTIVIAAANEPGDLQVRGTVVFESYYRNAEATTQSFTPDGWFHTGDRAMIDPDGYLHILGRTKETMNINGVKISPLDIQSCLEQALKPFVSRVICFPSRAAKSNTEQITVIYVPLKWPPTPEDISRTDDEILQVCLLAASAVPFRFCLEDETLLPQTTLGKISKAKMRSLFESGAFKSCIEFHQSIGKRNTYPDSKAVTQAEGHLLMDFIDVLGASIGSIGAEDTIFDIGATSVDLIQLKRRIDSRLSLDTPMITLIQNPTARSLAIAIENLKAATVYNPVVILQASGQRTPLWLVHPGVGEILVFLGLSQHMEDRPIYALRARGFDGDRCFETIAEVVDTYVKAIKGTQPSGPYAIAGYSYGTMLAFEIAKVLEQTGTEVRFVGSFNLPPHIKQRMQQLTWTPCLLHLAYFLGLIEEEHSSVLEKAFAQLTRSEALAALFDICSQVRLEELGLDLLKISTWADVAYSLQSMAVDYEPSGDVSVMDVFHAIPLKIVAQSREEWLEKHLSRWAEYCRSEPRFHEVGGSHYTMLGVDHVLNFSCTLQKALHARGV